ncbi:Hypothetical protein SMAX5B_019215, partial [Scophthalmus maximus]
YVHGGPPTGSRVKADNAGVCILWRATVVSEVADLHRRAPDQTQLCKYWARPNRGMAISHRWGCMLWHQPV